MAGKWNGRIILPVLQADRTAMVNQMFAAAEQLGIERWQIRSISEGFDVPREIAAYLFPSLFTQE